MSALVAGLAAVGLVFSFSGALGIVRMPDLYARIQYSSVMITMGALPALVALVVGEGPITNYGGRALLVAVLVLVVGPVAAHALGRAAYKTGVPMWRGSVVDQVRERRDGDGDNGEDR